MFTLVYSPIYVSSLAGYIENGSYIWLSVMILEGDPNGWNIYM